MNEKDLVIENAEHVVVDGEIKDDINEGGNFSEEVETTSEASEEETPEEQKKEDDCMEEMHKSLVDLESKYNALLTKFDQLITNGAAVVDDTEEETVDDVDITEDYPNTLDDLDFRVSKFN